jgi:hypothetical protein
MDDHHIGGRANSPITVSVPANDHRARLSEDQRDWPREALENADGSPLLIAAGCISGFIDFALYLIDELLIWIADMLEILDAHLVEMLGRQWWRTTPIEQFTQKRNRLPNIKRRTPSVKA